MTGQMGQFFSLGRRPLLFPRVYFFSLGKSIERTRSSPAQSFKLAEKNLFLLQKNRLHSLKNSPLKAIFHALYNKTGSLLSLLRDLEWLPECFPSFSSRFGDFHSVLAFVFYVAEWLSLTSPPSERLLGSSLWLLQALERLPVSKNSSAFPSKAMLSGPFSPTPRHFKRLLDSLSFSLEEASSAVLPGFSKF